MSTLTLARPVGFGALAFGLLFAAFVAALAFVSGGNVAAGQFADLWYYLLLLAAGFGVQVGLYVRLRQVVGRAGSSGKVVATSGATSTAAMVSCCAHYLANIAPALGATGIVALDASFQQQFMWAALALNVAGIAYVANRLFNASKEHRRCLA